MSQPISLFFPMYNEEANVEKAVTSAVAVLSKMTDEFEVVVVDDGSLDRTVEIAQRLRAQDPRVRLIEHASNQGYGSALRSGFAASVHPLVCFIDGDNQFDVAELPLLIDRLPGADIVCGYRIARRDPWYRRLNAGLYNGLVRLLFDVTVRDVNCAFKLFRREALDDLELKSTGALINAEVLARARKRGAVIEEIGVHHYPRLAGTQTGNHLGVVARAFSELFTLWSELR